MKRTSTQRYFAATVLGAGLVCLVVSPVFGQGNPLRKAYFGETHIHTSYSLDAWIAGTEPRSGTSTRTRKRKFAWSD
jgi:hypothetical protein